jgi:hypothetical protein
MVKVYNGLSSKSKVKARFEAKEIEVWIRGLRPKKESKVKPNKRKRQEKGFEAEERGFEDQIWNVQIILAVSFCFNV